MTPMMNNPQYQAAWDAVKVAQKIVIVTHVKPDGDAIGSALGLAWALQEMGKKVTVANDDFVPDYLQFLPGTDLFRRTLHNGKWDVMISTDASDEPRTGLVGAYARAHSQTVINLDHHITNTLFGDIHLVVPAAVSATEIVFEWWQFAGHTISKNTATALLTGLVTDTIGFRINTVTANTLRIAQALMQAGASLTEITARTLDTRSYRVIDLWKHALPSVLLEDGVIQGTVQLTDVSQAGLDDVTDGGLVSFLNQVNEAMVAVVFKEQPEQKVEISLRSKPGFNVGDVAFVLGGGGHKQAAGATISGTLDEVKAKVLPLLKEAVAAGKLEIV
jgi:phosphoesterase RecJ-like protein